MENVFFRIFFIPPTNINKRYIAIEFPLDLGE